MKSMFVSFGAAAALAVLPLLAASHTAHAGERYAERPPVVVSPDLSAPWVLQLRRAPVAASPQRQPVTRYHPGEPLPARATYSRLPAPALRGTTSQRAARPDLRNSYVVPAPRNASAAQRPTIVPMYTQKEMSRTLNPKFLPQEVAYDGPHRPGTIVVDTTDRFLYLVEPGGKARRYGVGVGKEGFGWSGTNPITRKAEWPTWTPPAEMIKREARKGRILPARMDGGPENPLGARALYLGDTLYRIHGTNAPWTIGQNVSSGCIRMRNEDVVDLYERVGVGTKVVVM